MRSFYGLWQLRTRGLGTSLSLRGPRPRLAVVSGICEQRLAARRTRAFTDTLLRFQHAVASGEPEPNRAK